MDDKTEMGFFDIELIGEHILSVKHQGRELYIDASLARGRIEVDFYNHPDSRKQDESFTFGEAK